MQKEQSKQPEIIEYVLGCGKLEKIFIIRMANSYLDTLFQANSDDVEKIRTLQEVQKEVNELKDQKKQKRTVGFLSIIAQYKFDKQVAIDLVKYLLNKKIEEQRKAEEEKLKSIKLSPEIIEKNGKINTILLWKQIEGMNIKEEYSHDISNGKLYKRNTDGQFVEVDVERVYKICMVNNYLKRCKENGEEINVNTASECSEEQLEDLYKKALEANKEYETREQEAREKLNEVNVKEQ